ncbi:aspartyl/asparaginyl beta-hydroxylase domain-containing protein [Verrucomicrobium spinosum]
MGHDIRSWQPGRCLVFDDTTEHEAGTTPKKTGSSC